ncbi:MAG: FHA domain-containing protein, partial [Kofleriaceae bacterium]
MIIARLAVLAGPDLGAEFQIGADGGAIGRGAGCAVKLTDPAASRTHAVLAVREGVLHLRDEGGPNPTLVNGSPHGDGALREFCLVSVLRNIHGLACWLIDSRLPLQ